MRRYSRRLRIDTGMRKIGGVLRPVDVSATSRERSTRSGLEASRRTEARLSVLIKAHPPGPPLPMQRLAKPLQPLTQCKKIICNLLPANTCSRFQLHLISVVIGGFHPATVAVWWRQPQGSNVRVRLSPCSFSDTSPPSPPTRVRTTASRARTAAPPPDRAGPARSLHSCSKPRR